MEAVLSGSSVPKDAGLLAGDRAFFFPFFEEGDVVAAADVAFFVFDLCETTERDAVEGTKLQARCFSLAFDDGLYEEACEKVNQR